MTIRFPELDQVRVTVDSDTRDRHLAAVTSALQSRATTPKRGRGRFLAVALAVVLLLPVIALAAEDSVPGDLLYPFKRAVEPVVQVFDTEAPAERRVREVEVLFDRNAPDEVIVRHVDVARETVTDGQRHLSDRIDRVVHELDVRRTHVEKKEEPVEPRPLVTEPSDRPTDSVAERPNEKSSPSSTVVDDTTDSTQAGDRRGDG